MYETIKKDLYNFIKSYQNLPKAEVVRRFSGLGYKKFSVYRWLNVIEKDKTFNRKLNIISLCETGVQYLT
ncbi:hypothetical protein BpHYR1_044973 [Brachionus plicatilis]|uniref:Uncharacterized protein n=1 Tax=Brachionus plicatilis TaxID=10195 RepID=A0A3M7Q7E6_BRAPC|nr:hypothetical protein BpHYR1_044973 [Brachionus plicatilis]